MSVLILSIRWHLNIRLGVEDVTADSLCNSHAKIDKKTDSRDPNSGIVLVGTRQEGVIMVMVTMVRVTKMTSSMLHGGGARARAGEW
jgi:hypothetical protein